MFKRLIKISRPRFWFYVLGPFAIGVAAARPDAGNVLPLLWWGLYWTLPANLFVYGINDIYDAETDALNPQKKGEYEAKVSPAEHRRLGWAAVLLSAPWLFSALWLAPFPAQIALAAFLVLSWQYSAPPLRAKGRPFVDSLCNILYLMPGALGFSLVTGQFPPLVPMIAGAAWCMAMHAFSAVPDIQADTAAGVQTIATRLGEKKTILLCAGLYMMAGLAAWTVLPWWLVLMGVGVYGGMMLRAFQARNHAEIMAVYKRFPLINVSFGCLLFLTILVNSLKLS